MGRLRSRTYLPHRALVALGAMLITVSIAGAALGVRESGRAEKSAALMKDRYLVLQAPTRAARTALSNFHSLAEQAYLSPDKASLTALLTGGVAASQAFDGTYATLQRLLALPVNAGLAPALPQLETAYIVSRGGLATLLTSPLRSPLSVQVATVERTAFNSLDAAYGVLQTKTSTMLDHEAKQVQSDSRTARNGLLASIAFGIVFGVSITMIFARKAVRLEHDLAARDAVQARLTRRNEFEGRLQRALEMAKAEPPVFDLVTQGLADAAPGLYAELLLADSSRAHFRQVLVSPPATTETGCGVLSPEDCPAASRGQAMVFPDSTAMDACPNLRGRACSALCVPVSISGSSVGVVHVTAIDGVPPADEITRDVEVVVRRASERLAMLRAFEVSQTEANTDSLTGLLTRRSLQSQTRDLQESGRPYAVAYGDLDHFKALNDVFGHDSGDRALRTFSQVLRDALRPSDIPCRYGGEEFVVLLPDCPVDAAVAVLERIRQRLAQRLESGHLPTFTVGFGVASSDQADDFEQVVAMADGALLQAKAAGRDQVVVARPDEPAGHPGPPKPLAILPLAEALS
jgi:diguanylate cyclase (GGDEF)-like protein